MYTLSTRDHVHISLHNAQAAIHAAHIEPYVQHTIHHSPNPHNQRTCHELRLSKSDSCTRVAIHAAHIHLTIHHSPNPHTTREPKATCHGLRLPRSDSCARAARERDRKVIGMRARRRCPKRSLRNPQIMVDRTPCRTECACVCVLWFYLVCVYARMYKTFPDGL